MDRDRCPRPGRPRHLGTGPATPRRQQTLRLRNSTNPSLLQGICACASCGYAYYRTSTRTTNKIIYYYRCLGSDNHRYQHGRVCTNKPVRADYFDSLVWDYVATLLADPTLIRAEIAQRLAHARTADPATAQRQRLNSGLTKASEAIKRLIGAYQEQLITRDELRSRMPELRNREAGLRQQIEALDAQLADREIYLTLADNVANFLTGLKNKAAAASTAERQRVLRLLVKDVLVSPDKITIRHSIPVRHNPTSAADTDQEGESSPNCQLRWRSLLPAAGQHRVERAGRALRRHLGGDRRLLRTAPAAPPRRGDLPAHPLCG
jgi:site-specific DNA recombinase